MIQVNMPEAENDLSRLIRMLESREEDIIYIARNGKAVAQITLIPKEAVSNRIGVAEGKFKVPKDFAAGDKEIEDMFGDHV